jgi:hypothetical protein
MPRKDTRIADSERVAFNIECEMLSECPRIADCKYVVIELSSGESSGVKAGSRGV